ncbi:IgGFc-binding protein-like [Pyxicephalus adspersus]|uniref:IgGFc-binding protein-like n=1 Tax=Pyxicephalus adspersus TaxID=30357 RepID=UPI003B5C8C44
MGKAAREMGSPNVLSCLFLLCLGYTFCSAGVPGTEFITAFMQNHDKNTGDPDLKLFITAFSDATTVTIRVNKLKFRKDIRLDQLQDATIDLPNTIQISGSGVSSYSVIVTSNNPISVVSQNYKTQSLDSASLYPVTELGNEYYIFTPLDSAFKEFAIIAKEPTKVTIYPTGLLTYQGKKYNKNSKLSIEIDPYDVVQLQSEDDLSGSRVVATKPVAVLSGHTCSLKLTKCNHVYEQLQPVLYWGTTFFVPPVSFQTEYDLVYVMAANFNTDITYQTGSKQENLELAPGEVIEIELDPKAPLFINSTEGIQVMFYGTGGHSGHIDFDTVLMTVPDVWSFCTSYKTSGLDDFTNKAIVVAKTSDLKDLTVDKASLDNIDWQKIPGTEYSYGEYPLSSSNSYIFESSKSSFSLSTFGIAELNSYGETAVCLGGSSRPSCSQLKCRKGEVCKINNGKAKCEGNSEATCWAWGDPHYHTFDGKNYDFQGTCSYTMSKTCGSDADLPFFNIETVNENRGSSLVSYLKSVNIQVYDYIITGLRSEFGIIRINNQITQLPVKLQNNKVVITQSGSSLILVTDFKLKVIYDWNILLKITIPSSYYNNVCGMCGNYNGNPRDDLYKDGKELNSTEYGKLWKVETNSVAGCSDDCKEGCPSCSKEKTLQYGNEQFCGILTQKHGPFKVCHEKIDPTIYKDNCVFDLCLNEGYNQILCQTLKAYSDACAREGIQIKDWREATDCPMHCPGNSTYNQCGSSCPATCQDPQAPSKCTDPCIETCECDSGFVMIEGQCQPKENCGCFYQGRSLNPGATFWDDADCKRKCYCNSTTRKVECSNTKCGNGQQCMIKDGIQDCYPIKYSTCTGSGDPHYVTFDDFHYDFQGACEYLLSGLHTQKNGLADFQVIVHNDHQGSLLVSYTTAVIFRIFETEIQIRREFPAVVLVDGIKSNLPLSMRLKLGNINIFQSGRQCIVQTNIGIRVTFDWEARVGVMLPSSYSGYVHGLCGNFNNKVDDDLIARDGKFQLDIPLFGHSWREGERADECKIVKPNNCTNLLALEGQQKKNLQECGMVLDEKGPFRDCHSKINPSSYFEDCIYDMCAYGKRKDLMCRLLTAYTASCQEAGAVVYDWRSDIICPMSCQLNSKYSICANPCPSTCLSVSLASKCGTVCHEGCECEQGYVLSGSECVPLSQCGCLYNDQYYKPGDIFYPESTCERKCTCNGGGSVTCESTSCGPYEQCSVVKGVQSCNPIGSAVCSTIGKTSFNTFDNFGYDFSGNCSYILSQTCLSEGSKLTPYIIRMRNIESSVSITKKITVEVYNYTVTIYQGPENKILVNDIFRNLPFELEAGKLRAEYQGGGAVLKTDFGLTVTSDNAIHVTVPGNYHTQTCGLCGNYNDNDKDDFSPNDDDVVAFAESWRDSDEVCITNEVCDARDKSCSDCPKKVQKQLAGESLCGILVKADGPFAPCHKVYDPTAYLKSCVNILCAKTGELCPILQGYVKICQDAGVIMKPWRSPSFCPYTCSEEHSHYEFCADVCATSCSSLYDITSCPTTCSEGCQCDTGFLFQNGRCVTPKLCDRCILNSTFYQVNETIISEDCSQICTCNSHHVATCEPYSCASDEVCKVLDGKVQCVNKDPCKSVSCRNKEHCESTNDKPICVPDYTSSCTGWGDPHYTTFDGYNFDFHGTCTYILAEYLAADTTLEYFRIEEKNDNRGSLTSSSVRLVNIFAYGFNISVLKDEVGQVWVNGEIRLLPLSLLNDKLIITQIGAYATLKTDFGLRVAFDYNWHVEITLPSSYYGATGGLCGNFNNNPRDDKMSRENQQLNAITKWAQSWKVMEDDDFCSDTCQGICLECNKTKKAIYEGDEFCGIIEAEDGPFKDCHSIISTSIYFINCVNDVCSHDGSGLCQALESYVTACRRQGIEIPNWRSATGCNKSCPENSHYEYCGSACPASCSDRNAPVRCTESCVETCQCNDGYILSAGSCIDVKTCGCLYNGLYYQANQEFWSDDKCSVRCKCDPDLGMVVCSQKRCQDTERCMLKNGVRDCYPVSYSTCISTGDPHYTTFDGKTYDFMGTCIYQLAGLCSRDPYLTPFNIKIQNDKRSSKVVSYTNALTLEVYNHTITLTRKYPQRVLVDGVAKFIPFSLESNKIKVFMKGEHAFVRTDFEVTMNYNWDNYGRVMVPSTYANALCGLCGNFNQDPSDDLTPNDSKDDGIKFEDRYKVGDVPECKAGCEGKCPKCSDKETQQYSSKKYCGLLKLEDGPLSECYTVLDPASYFSDCVFDSCQYKGRFSAVCSAIARYVSECQEKGVQVKEWRKNTICEPTCPPNSHYELCGPGCHDTCSNLNSASGCEKSCTEGCYCDKGFILSGDICVPISDCGCNYDNSYYQKGQIFYPEGGCNEQCQCGENGEVQCQAVSCGPNEECKVVDGAIGCHSKNIGTCLAASNSHFISFDGVSYSLQGSCSYVLTDVCNSGLELRNFSVIAESGASGEGKIRGISALKVFVAEYEITMERNIQWAVKINEELYNLPLILNDGEIHINQEGSNIVVKTAFELTVLYDLVNSVHITVPGTYQGAVCGLCGDFNGNADDDFRLPSGQLSTSAEEFGAAWNGDETVKDCRCKENCNGCDHLRAAIFGRDEACGQLQSEDGPFAECYGLVNVTEYFNQCLLDMCASDGQPQILCDSIQAYATACLAAGAKPKSWRTPEFCAPACPENSHYELCTHTCDVSCSGVIAPSSCSAKCSAGCQCDEGYLFDGGRCVSMDRCGCFYNGRSYGLGDTIFSSDCLQRCTCQSGGNIECSDFSCSDTQYCGLQEGTRQCLEKHGTCTFSAQGRLTSFDLLWGTVASDNIFDLTSVCDLEAENWFRIVVITQSCNNDEQCKISAVHVYFTNASIAVTPSGGVWENGRPVDLPYVFGQVTVDSVQGGVVLKSGEDLELIVNETEGLTVTVDQKFFGGLCGACGNFNRDKSDDLRNRKGKPISSFSGFLASWRAVDFVRCSP